jgi:hypothetical protein
MAGDAAGANAGVDLAESMATEPDEIEAIREIRIEPGP